MTTNSGDPNPDSPPSTPEKYSFFMIQKRIQRDPKKRD